MNTGEVIERIKQMAIQLCDGQIKPKMTESEVLISLIIPRAIEVVYQDELDGTNYLSVTSEHVLNFANGEAAIPTGVSEGYVRFILFLEDQNASYVQSWTSFKNCLEGAAFDTCPKNVSRFTIRNSKIYYMERGQVWNAFDGELTIQAITLPSIGAASTDEFDVSAEFLQKLIVFVAGIVSEKIPITAIGLTTIQDEEEDE